jgi:hypothetical protein
LIELFFFFLRRDDLKQVRATDLLHLHHKVGNVVDVCFESQQYALELQEVILGPSLFLVLSSWKRQEDMGVHTHNGSLNGQLVCPPLWWRLFGHVAP